MLHYYHSDSRRIPGTGRQDKCVKSGGCLGKTYPILDEFGLDLTIQAEQAE